MKKLNLLSTLILVGGFILFATGPATAASAPAAAASSVGVNSPEGVDLPIGAGGATGLIIRGQKDNKGNVEFQGNLRLGTTGITTGSACSVEAMVGYDLALHEPVFCNASKVWSKIFPSSAFENMTIAKSYGYGAGTRTVSCPANYERVGCGWYSDTQDGWTLVPTNPVIPLAPNGCQLTSPEAGDPWGVFANCVPVISNTAASVPDGGSTGTDSSGNHSTGGFLCGLTLVANDGNLYPKIPCMGLDPAVACPSGYSQVANTNGTNGFYMCAKAGS
jgi:hypothetical protein